MALIKKPDPKRKTCVTIVTCVTENLKNNLKMGRKNTITEANQLIKNKKTFVYLITSTIDMRAQRNICVVADDEQSAYTWMIETFTGYHVALICTAKGAEII